MEKALHDNFVEAYQFWQKRAIEDEAWTVEKPFYFNVERYGRIFASTQFGGSKW
jgi:hypothetical protein